MPSAAPSFSFDLSANQPQSSELRHAKTVQFTVQLTVQRTKKPRKQFGFDDYKRTENPCVGGSIPPLSTFRISPTLIPLALSSATSMEFIPLQAGPLSTFNNQSITPLFHFSNIPFNDVYPADSRGITHDPDAI